MRFLGDGYRLSPLNWECEAMRKLFTTIGVALALCDAHAQDLEAVRACTRLSDNAARLACYDAAVVEAITPSVPKLSVPKLSAEKPEPQPKFGDNGQLHRDIQSKADLPKSLTGQLSQVASLPHGLYRLSLDNGQIWQTTEADSALEFKAGDMVTISRMVLGGYIISFSAHTTSVGAKRIK
jgi:lactam utilization protein B